MKSILGEVTMLYEQKGWKVSLSRLAGHLGTIAMMLCLSLYALGFLTTMRDENGWITILNATFFYLIIIGGIMGFLIYHVWKFPDIRVVDNGINLTVFFYTMHIDWKNIKQIRKSQKELFIILTNKGLLLNRLYGLLSAREGDQPVVLFISSEEKVNRLEKDLRMRIMEEEG